MRCKALLLAIGLVCLSACNRNTKKRIAVIPKGTAQVFWQTIHAGAVAAGREFDLEILWDGPPSETDYARQLEIFDSMLNRHVDGIVVSAADKSILSGSLDRAAKAGIPVVVFDSGVESTNYVSFVATNNYQAGQLGARKLAELIGGKGPIAMLSHAPGSGSTMDRERGFKDAVRQEFPGIQIVAEQFSMADRAKGLASAENILASQPGLAGIFASSEPSAVGVARAVKTRGLAGKLKFVGFDSTDGLLEDVTGGVIDALVVQDPFKIGYEGVRVVRDRLAGATPPKQIDLTAAVVSKADLDKPEIKALLHPDLEKYLGK